MKSKPRLTALSCIAICMIIMSTYTKTSGITPASGLIHTATFPLPADWASATSYSTGSYVKYMNKVYRAAHLTQGDTPRGFGLYPDGPWIDEGYCL
jgi:hypothetical protein